MITTTVRKNRKKEIEQIKLNDTYTTMRIIKTIFIHCSAGFGDWKSVREYWRKTLGWVSPGYHSFIDTKGGVKEFAPYWSVTNGVKGYNSSSIHICYQGGVNPKNYKEAMDTRTPEQKEVIKSEIKRALRYLKYQGQDISKIKIKGHRDISPDKNLNGKVDPWERIKECPSFEVGNQYDHLIQEVLDEPEEEEAKKQN